MNLEVINITKRFDKKLILSNFSYKFEKTGTCIITGESGIGKTTLLRIIAGLDTDYAGNVTNGGLCNVSFMFQEYRLFPTLTAVKNAAISNDVKSTEAAAILLERLGFNESDLTKYPDELSGGMKQRVSFVRAIMKDSPILILDEPTKELDSHTSEIMIEMINEEAQKRLVIIVTHDDICKKILTPAIIRL